MKTLISMVLLGFGVVGCSNAGDSLASDSSVSDVSTARSVITESLKNVAVTSTAGTGSVAVDAGYASDGVTISVPTTFLSTNCKFTAAPADIDGSAISTSASISSTGVVACKKLVAGLNNGDPAQAKGCVVSYTMVCVQ